MENPPAPPEIEAFCVIPLMVTATVSPLVGYRGPPALTVPLRVMLENPEQML
jgi:hypothetical protein